MEPVSYIYKYRINKDDFQIYIMNKIYIYKSKIIFSKINNIFFQIYSICNMLNFLWKDLSRKYIPSISFPILEEIFPTLVQIINLYIVIWNKNFRNNYSLYILHFFFYFDCVVLISCILTNYFLKKWSLILVIKYFI